MIECTATMTTRHGYVVRCKREADHDGEHRGDDGHGVGGAWWGNGDE